MNVTLRAAAPVDCELVYAWNFAPDVRARSGDPTVVEVSRHAAWYARRIAAPDAPIWIIETAGMPVGVVRIDADGRISIAVSAEARGHGVGKRAISAACATWNQPVVADVKTENMPSRAVFEACGFVEHARAAGVVTYHWRP